MESDLLTPATADLLEWTGPVVAVGMEAVFVGPDTRPEAQRAGPWIVVREDGEWGDTYGGPGCEFRSVRTEEIRLDLSRAECRDRMARCLAARLLRDLPPNGDGYSWRSEPVGICWELRSHNLNWTARFGPDTSGWFGADEGNRTGRFPSRSVPALAALDPHDDARLADGSRRVDALALRLCWEASRG